MSMYKLCCFSVPIGGKKMISSQQIRHGALQKPPLSAMSLPLECSPRCVCSSGCIRSACSHPACKLYEMVIYAQPLEDASLVSKTLGDFVSENLPPVFEFRQTGPEILKGFHRDCSSSPRLVGC